MQCLLIIFLILFFHPAFSAVSFRAQAGIGFTDNANYEESEKDTDFFGWTRLSSSYLSDHSTWNLWLNYKGFLKEHQNDVLSYRLGHTLETNTRSFGSFDWDLAVGGQKYSQGNPGTTETSFDQTYLETSVEKIWSLRKDLEMSWEPLYQYKFFPQFDGRVDQTILSHFGADWSFQSIQSLAPFLEIGWVASNQSIYTKNYLEIGTDWRISERPDLRYSLGFLSRYSSFPNRKISDVTVVSTKNGRFRTLSQDGNETQSLVQFQGSLVKIVNELEWKSSLVWSKQYSNSGFESYSEFQLTGSVLIPF
jgi:hypothetical protein